LAAPSFTAAQAPFSSAPETLASFPLPSLPDRPFALQFAGAVALFSPPDGPTRLFQQLRTVVLNRPSQQVWRELALGERFLGFSRLGRSTGPPQKPQESCHPAGGSGERREWITLKLAERVGLESKGLKEGAFESARFMSQQRYRTPKRRANRVPGRFSLLWCVMISDVTYARRRLANAAQRPDGDMAFRAQQRGAVAPTLALGLEVRPEPRRCS
jgi:hypothetical protein